MTDCREKTARVVVADDQPLYCEGVKAVLAREKVGEVVGEASGLEQAAQVIERTRPDVVLLSAGIVRGDCMRVMSDLCRSGEWRVIIVGEDEDSDAAVEWVKAGATGYISRKAACEQVAKAVMAARRGEPWIARRVAGVALQQLREQKSAPAGKPLLSAREQEVMRLVAQGWRNSEIAAALYISEKTVKTHLSSIFQKLGVRDRLQAALAAVREGIADGKGAMK